MQLTVYTKSLPSSSATSIAASQAATAGTPLTLTSSTVTIDSVTSTNSAIGRRVLITSTSATETATIAITGTNANAQVITETITFSGASTTLQSNLDYVTVTKVLPSGTIAGNLSAGTNGVGSSPWKTWNYIGKPPMNLTEAVELVSGSVNFTIQYTYDDPNNLPSGVTTPLAFNMATITGQTATIDGSISIPIVATRVLINSGTGVIRVREMQAGVG